MFILLLDKQLHEEELTASANCSVGLPNLTPIDTQLFYLLINAGILEMLHFLKFVLKLQYS